MNNLKPQVETQRNFIVSVMWVIWWVYGLLVDLVKASFFGVVGMLIALIYYAGVDTTVYQLSAAMHGDAFWKGALMIAILYVAATRGFGGTGKHAIERTSCYGADSAVCTVNETPVSK